MDFRLVLTFGARSLSSFKILRKKHAILQLIYLGLAAGSEV